MDILDFMSKKSPKWGGKLWPFKAQIIELHKRGYSLASICEFLQSNNVTVSRPSVSAFIKKIQNPANEFSEPKEHIQKNEIKHEVLQPVGPRSFSLSMPEVDITKPLFTNDVPDQTKIDELRKKLERK